MIAIQLQNIRGLKQSGLYLLVGRSSRVGIALHRTNVLSHDQHYRHVALLWDELHHTNELASRTPAETFEANQQLELNYSRYIGLVLRHALVRYRFEPRISMLWAGHQLQILQRGLDWHLMVSGVAVLELVSWACLDELPSDVVQDKSHRVLCWPGIELGDVLGSAMTGAALRLSPMDLYTVERLGAVVDESLSRVLLSHYGKPIQPLPAAVVAETQQVKGLRTQGHSLQVLGQLSDDITARVQDLFAKHARRELSQAFMKRIAEARALSLCPVCDAPAELIAQMDGGFSSSCRSCSCKRYWRKNNTGHWEYQQLLSGGHEFRITGRRSMVLYLTGRRA